MASAGLVVESRQDGFGAAITRVNLAGDLEDEIVNAIRTVWLHHRVVYFPDQPLTHMQLERFTTAFGEFGTDPYVKSLDEHANILEVRREPDETVAPFGASWHSDWSFQRAPPAATILHAKVVPPVGGATLYADGVRAYEALDPALRDELDTLRALHSARRPYSHEGYARTGGAERSMQILPSDDAWATQSHPVVRTHPETGQRALWVNPVYTLAIENMSEKESQALLKTLYEHCLSETFVYKHRWSANMLTMWDNRSVQHCAQGGYDGHRRVMHRTVVAGDRPF